MNARLARSTRRLLGGAAQTLGIVAAFVGLGLLGAAFAAGVDGERGPRGAERALQEYALGMDPDPSPARNPTVWLVDGYNALHVGLLRGGDREGAWWSRAGREALLERVRRFDGGAGTVSVVFDGPDPRELPDPGAPVEPGSQPRLVFAPSADDWLLRRARDAAPGEVAIVTADRRLAARARARGATVVSPREFLARCGVEETASI